MLNEIETVRLLNMTDQEKRWFNNIKKGFYESDLAILEGDRTGKCLDGQFKALDAAKNLRRSLIKGAEKKVNQRDQYISFIELEVPSPSRNGMNIPLTNARTGEEKPYSFAELVYDARCMLVHENENLNAAEKPTYHIQFDWNTNPTPYIFGKVTNGNLVVDGDFFTSRIRQILAKFITGIDSMISFHTNKTFAVTIVPDFGSIKPT